MRSLVKLIQGKHIHGCQRCILKVDSCTLKTSQLYFETGILKLKGCIATGRSHFETHPQHAVVDMNFIAPHLSRSCESRSDNCARLLSESDELQKKGDPCVPPE